MMSSLKSCTRIAPLVGFFVVLAGCGREPAADLVEVELALALDFESNDILTVSVYDEALVACGTLTSSGAGDVEPEAFQNANAQSLNAGGSVDLQFDELRAETPLAFHGTVTRAGELLAEDCATATVPRDGSVEVVLTVAAP